MSKAPKLRFKEFSGDWESKKLGDLGDVTKLAGFEFTNHVEYSDTGEIIALRGLNVKNGKLILDDVKYIDNSDFSKLNRSKLFIDDLLFTYVGTVGETALIDKNDKYYLAPNVSRIRFDLNESNSKFMHYNISRSEYFNKVIQPSIATSSQPALSMENIRKLNINIPSKEEQEKIASFFSLIDDKISLQGQKVESLKDYKRGMMQKIFGRELRFKDDEGRDYPEWKSGKVKDVITEHLYPIEKPSDSYWRLGLRSHGKGTFHEYVTDPSKVSMDKLYEVKKNMLIVNITFAWEHAIAITDANDEGKLVSHRFPTYDFNENALYDFYKYYILLPKFKYCLVNSSPGGAGRNRVLNKKQFLEIDVPIPCIDEQKKIAKILNKLDIKINKAQEKLDSLNEYKKGLLQQMFV